MRDERCHEFSDCRIVQRLATIYFAGGLLSRHCHHTTSMSRITEASAIGNMYRIIVPFNKYKSRSPSCKRAECHDSLDTGRDHMTTPITICSPPLRIHLLSTFTSCPRPNQSKNVADPIDAALSPCEIVLPAIIRPVVRLPRQHAFLQVPPQSIAQVNNDDLC